MMAASNTDFEEALERASANPKRDLLGPLGTEQGQKAVAEVLTNLMTMAPNLSGLSQLLNLLAHLKYDIEGQTSEEKVLLRAFSQSTTPFNHQTACNCH